VRRLARFADHLSLRTTRTRWSFEGSPSKPAAFATARPLRVSVPVLSLSRSACARPEQSTLRPVARLGPAELLSRGSAGRNIRACPPRFSACPPRFRFQMRLAKDLQCLEIDSYDFASKSIDEIGRLVGGWLRRRSSGRRPFHRLLRGGAFNNQPSNVRSASPNWNQPANRNNNAGFRLASAWQRGNCLAPPEFEDEFSVSKCAAKSKPLSRGGREVLSGQTKNRPGGSSWASASNAPPGQFPSRDSRAQPRRNFHVGWVKPTSILA
jgi:hypothetical protein